jgi:hypothetical protein
VGLSGTLSTFPLSDLLQWLGSTGKTGTLRVRAERYTRTVYLKEGRIVSSGSDDPTEQLGQFLLSHGRISEEDLRIGLETQARTRVLLGRILLMTGKIEEGELKRLLTQKAEETIFGLFLWTEAHFDFEDGELPGSLFVPIGLDVQEVLRKGAAVVDELRHIRRELGSSGSVPQRTQKKLPQGFPAARSMERAVLALVDGHRTVAEICLAVHASEFTVGRMLLQFLDMGCITVARRVEPPAPRRAAEPERAFVSADSLVARARELLDGKDPEQALDLLRQALSISPRDHRIKKMFDEAGAAFREEAYARWLPPTATPSVARDLSSLTSEPLGPEEMFLLSRINGSWDVKSIIDISPLGEVEALRQMKRLLDRGLIQLA